MAGNEVEELVDKGIAALKAGQKTEARHCLADAVEQDPENERGWLYLATLLPRQQAVAALERVLTLNPDNKKAQRGLETLQKQITEPMVIPPQIAKKSLAARKAILPTPPPVEETLPPPPPPKRTPAAPSGGGLQERLRGVMPEEIEPAYTQQGGYIPIEVDTANDDPQPRYVPEEQSYFEETLPVRRRVRQDELPSELRTILIEPPQVVKRQHAHPLLVVVLMLLIFATIGGGVYYYLTLNNYAFKIESVELSPTPIEAATVNFETPIVTTDALTQAVETIAPVETTKLAAPISNFDSTDTPLPPTQTPVPTKTPIPTPTVPPVIKLSVAQNERATLRGYNVIFSEYENRSNNFSFAGAGTPKTNYHYEGVIVQLYNTSSTTLPVQIEDFAAVDGRNQPLLPIGGGRVPALDVRRLQPNEYRSGWLTFEVEDGTTLRRVAFKPTASIDFDNSADVNLTLPAAPISKPITPTLRPRASPTAKSPVVSVTATPAPTIVPQNEMAKRVVLETFAITATTYVFTPTIKPPPLISPPGYHYETVRITLESSNPTEAATYLESYPFYLRDGTTNEIFTVGPLSLEAKDRLNPQSFVTTTIKPVAGKIKNSGTLYFLVRDNITNSKRTLIFYSKADIDSPRVEIILKP